MKPVLEKTVMQGQAPVHVLIIVVGKYVSSSRNLPGAGAFAQIIFNFWKSDFRIFPEGQVLGSVQVLASDPDSARTRIIHGATQPEVEAPTYQSVKDAMRAWVDRIATTEGAVGVLHWVGHGTESLRGGSVVSLDCEVAPGGTVQDGLNWTSTLHWLNERTAGRRVYCFIDACRTLPVHNREYLGIDSYDLLASQDGAYVFTSTESTKKAFWVTKAKPQAQNAGFSGYAVGTQAFLAGLESFGARLVPGSSIMPIVSAELVEASRALVRRWAGHQDLQAGQPIGPGGPDQRAILMTATPKSAVDIVLKNKQAVTCSANPDDPSISVPVPSETPAAPFQFRLARKPHRFKLDDGQWSQKLDLPHPHIELFDGESY